MYTPLSGYAFVYDKLKCKGDVYFLAGLGLESRVTSYLTMSDSSTYTINEPSSEYTVPVLLGGGGSLFLSDRISLNLEFRSTITSDFESQFDADIPVTEKSLKVRNSTIIGASYYFSDLDVSKIATPKVGLNIENLRIRIGGGISAVVSDPFLRLYGLKASYQQAIKNSLFFGADVYYFADLGEADWKPLTSQLVKENSVSPDISKMQIAVIPSLSIEPMTFDLSGLEAYWGVNMGIGVVQTKDDLETLQTTSEDLKAASTEVQWHPCNTFGTYVSFWLNDQIGVKLHLNHMTYIETVNATTLEFKNNKMINLEALWKL